MPRGHPPGAPQSSAEHVFHIDESAVGMRFDRWLAQQLSETSRTEVQRMIRAGAATVNECPAKPSYLLECNDLVRVRHATVSSPTLVEAEDIPIEIVYQDADVIVVDKPAGMVVHPAPGHSHGTLVNALLYHCPDIGKLDGERRPGIVHRLDKDTSGLILVAKHAHALRFLQKQFKARAVRKHYIALVEGIPDPAVQTVHTWLGRHPVDRKRQAAFPLHLQNPNLRVREAITAIERTAVYSVAVKDSNAVGNFSLVSAFPKTGRTHQIRVHLAWIRHPIVGDPLYGLKRPRLPVPRLFLHAHGLSLRLPSSGEAVVEFSSPLPGDLRAVLDRLESAE
jgi:23S rRNA pseudouridine1911/1915/1917 synthase